MDGVRLNDVDNLTNLYFLIVISLLFCKWHFIIIISGSGAKIDIFERYSIFIQDLSTASNPDAFFSSFLTLYINLREAKAFIL